MKDLLLGFILPLIYFVHPVKCLAASALDVFISKEEGQRIVGTPAEIYYVRQGVKSDYSLKFSPPVLHHIRNVSFCWTTNGQSSPLFEYILGVKHEPTEAMGPVTISIKTKGFVPLEKQEFTVDLPCTGKASQEVLVTISMTIRGGPHEYNLDIKRRRMCKASNQPHAPLPTVPAASRATIEDELLSSFDSKKTTNEISVTHGVVAGCFVAAILLVCVVTTAIACRSKKKPSSESTRLSSSQQQQSLLPIQIPQISPPESRLLPEIAESRTAAESSVLGGSTIRSPPPTIDAPHPSVVAERQYEFGGNIYETSRGTSIIFPGHPPSLLSQYAATMGFEKPEYPALDDYKEYIVAEEQLAEGNFGLIKRGRFINPNDPEISFEVFIKTLKPGCSSVHMNSLITQGSLLWNLEHEHVCASIGYVSAPVPMVLFRSMQSRIFKEVLTSPEAKRFTLIEMIGMGVQALRGIEFIHCQGIVHRDIAARNCLYHRNGEEHLLQITDDALARDLYPNDYLCLGDNENRPVKWMAYESLWGEFTFASDVWSFGVLMWEILSLGQTPYEDVDGFDMARYLGMEAIRLAKPALTCPGDLWNYILRCWVIAQEGRPTIPQLIAFLTEFRQFLADHFV